MSDSNGARNVTTPRLGLNKPLVGGDLDIWGDFLNSNCDTLDNSFLVTGGVFTGPVGGYPASTPGAPAFSVGSGAGIYAMGASMGVAAFNTNVFSFSLSTNTSSVPLSMANNRIMNLANPVLGTDAVNLNTVAAMGSAYLPVAGGQMLGPINMGGNLLTGLALPQNPADATSKQYVDALIADMRLFVDTWQVAANIPDISNVSTITAGDYYIAVTANPTVPETAPSNIPGIGGMTINNGDMVIYSEATAQYELVRGGPLTVAEADALFVSRAGDTMSGGLTINSTAGLTLRQNATGGVQGINYAGFGALGDNIAFGISMGVLYVYQNAVAVAGLLNLSGGAMTGGLGFGNAVASAPNDLTRHINLYGSIFGFSITNARLNYNAGGAAGDRHVFLWDGQDIVTIGMSGLSVLAGGILATGGSLTVDTILAGQWPIEFRANGGPLPGADFGGALGFNYSGGAGEADFINLYTSAADSFRFYQLTAGGTANLVASISAAGNLTVTGNIYNESGIYWAGTDGSYLHYNLANSVWALITQHRVMASIDPGGSFSATGWLMSNIGLLIQNAAGALRWSWRMDGEEAGGNTGSNLAVHGFNDDGSAWQVLGVTRGTGLATVFGDPVDPLGIATKQYVDAHSGGGGGPWLPLTGGTIDGDLVVINGTTTQFLAVGASATANSLVVATQAVAGTVRANGGVYYAGVGDTYLFFNPGNSTWSFITNSADVAGLNGAGLLTVASILDTGGVLQMRGSANYLQNTAAGTWAFVNAGVAQANLDSAGNLAVVGSVTAGGQVIAGGSIVVDSTQMLGFYLSTTGGNSVISFHGGTYMQVSPQQSLIYIVNGDQPTIEYSNTTGIFTNYKLGMQGFGPYTDLSLRHGAELHAEPMAYGLAQVLQLQPMSFIRQRRAGVPAQSSEIGFLAEAVQPIVPEAVVETEMDGEPVLGLRSSSLIAVTVNAIKELDVRLRALEGVSRRVH